MKVGLQSNPIPPIELTVGQAVAAEASGFDSIWYPDHLMGWFPRALWTLENSSIVGLLPSPHIYLDPAIVLALVGAQTKTALLGTAVTEPIRRPPAELARTFLTLGHASEGRAILGIGAGEKENVVPYGLDYGKQVSKLDEALEIIRLLWRSDGAVSFEGKFWKLDRAVLDLQPFGGEYPPIWIGAHGPRMLGITGRHGDGWLPSYPMDPAEYAAKLKVVRAAAEEAGRDPKAIEAAYQMYVVLTDDHDAAHRVLSSPLAGAMALVASSSHWERVGRKHPLGQGYEGLRDYVPEWFDKQELEAAVGQYDPDVFHDLVPHGTAEEIAASIEPYAGAGCSHVVLVNLAPMAGLEYLQAAQQNLPELVSLIKSM